MISRERSPQAVLPRTAVSWAATSWRHALFGAALLTALSAMASPSSAQPANAREQAALDVRYLQTELMVAALSCGRTDFHTRYNTFVAKFGSALKRHSNVMKAYFNRQYGSQGTKQLDAYVTRLANEASLRSMQQVSFCQDSSVLFERVTAIDAPSLDGFSAAIARNREMVAAGTPAAH
jgi:hypothetical protein